MKDTKGEIEKKELSFAEQMRIESSTGALEKEIAKKLIEEIKQEFEEKK